MSDRTKVSGSERHRTTGDDTSDSGEFELPYELDQQATTKLWRMLDELEIDLDDKPDLSEDALVDHLLTDEFYGEEHVSVPLSERDSWPRMAALTLATSSPSNVKEGMQDVDVAIAITLAPEKRGLAAASTGGSIIRTAVGKHDDTTYSLSVLGGGGCSLRVAGPAVSCGHQAVIELDGTERTGLRFDRFGFEAEPPDDVTGLIWDAMMGRRGSSFQLRFPRSRDTQRVESRTSVWEQWTDLIEDAERGCKEFVDQMDRIAVASNDLTRFSQWCDVIRTEILESWLFRENGFAQAAGRSGFGSHLLGPVLSIVLRRKLLSLRSVSERAEVSTFWQRTSALLLCGVNTSSNSKRVVEVLSDNRIGDLVPTSNDLGEIAVDEERFASELNDIAQQLSSIGNNDFSWAVSVLLEISAQRRRETTDRPAARIVAVWVPGVLSERAAAIIRPGMLLDFDYCLNSRGSKVVGAEFSRDFSAVLHKSDRLFNGVSLAPRKNLLRSRLGKGSLDGRSGSLGVETALKLAGLDRSKGKTRGIAPFVVVSAEKRDAHVEAVSGLEQKIEVLSEEGVRILIVADTQRQSASELAPRSMVVASPSTLSGKSSGASQAEEQIARSLLAKGLTGTVSHPVHGFKVAWFGVAAAALLMGFLSWRFSRPENSWQTEALAHHQRVGIQSHSKLWKEIGEISQHHSGEIAIVPLMRELNVLGHQDKVGIDPRFLASLMERAYPDVSVPDTPLNLEAHTDTERSGDTELDHAMMLCSSDDFQSLSERNTILDALATALYVGRDDLEIRAMPDEKLLAGGAKEVLYDGKVFDHADIDGSPLWKSLLDVIYLQPSDIGSKPSKTQLEHYIKTHPIEPAFFTRFIRWQLKESMLENDVLIELNTSGLGVIPVLESNDKVEVYVKSMPQSQWRPLQSIRGLEDVGLTVTTVLHRPVDTAPDGFSQTHVQAVYLNAFQDQSVRSLATNSDDDPENDILSDWWAARFERGTIRGDLAVAFPAQNRVGPQGDESIEPEFGFAARGSESARYAPIKKRVFRDGPRMWIVPEECDLSTIWRNNPDTHAAVVRFRARWSASEPE